MTSEEKFKAIVDRLHATGWCDDPLMISTMVIIHYLDELSKLKLVECEFHTTENARLFIALTEEFDWKPSDKDVCQFIKDMVEESDREAFFYLITKYRDDREALLAEIDEFKKNNGK